MSVFENEKEWKILQISPISPRLNDNSPKWGSVLISISSTAWLFKPWTPIIARAQTLINYIATVAVAALQRDSSSNINNNYGSWANWQWNKRCLTQWTKKGKVQNCFVCIGIEQRWGRRKKMHKIIIKSPTLFNIKYKMESNRIGHRTSELNSLNGFSCKLFWFYPRLKRGSEMAKIWRVNTLSWLP